MFDISSSIFPPLIEVEIECFMKITWSCDSQATWSRGCGTFIVTYNLTKFDRLWRWGSENTAFFECHMNTKLLSLNLSRKITKIDGYYLSGNGDIGFCWISRDHILMIQGTQWMRSPRDRSQNYILVRPKIWIANMCVCYKLGKACDTNWGSSVLVQNGASNITNRAAQLFQIEVSIVTNWSSCYKLWQLLFDNWAAIINSGNCYFRMGQLLQIVAKLITSQGKCYKLGQLLKIGA